MGRRRILDLVAQLQELSEPLSIEARFAHEIERREWVKGKSGKQRIQELLEKLQ